MKYYGILAHNRRNQLEIVKGVATDMEAMLKEFKHHYPKHSVVAIYQIC